MIESHQAVPVGCLDKPRSLLFSLNAAAEIKRSLGSSPIGWSKEDWARIADPESLLVVVKACMRHEDKVITTEQIGEMVCGTSQINELVKAVMRAWAHFNGMSDEQYEESMARAQTESEGIEAEDPTAAQKST
jgi:hypothetical protein